VKSIGSDKIKKVDVRLISATNQNLKDAIKEKRFAKTLFQACYRFRYFTAVE